MDASGRAVRRRYDRIAPLYDLFEAPMEYAFAKWRREVVGQIEGCTLEVGIGTGKNVPYYPVTAEVVGIDLSHGMLLQAKARHGGMASLHLAEVDAERLAFADGTFDTVLATCVFCSVADPVAGLRELGRVCRPGGRILLLEHVRSGRWLAGALMDVLNPVTVHLWGANINRRTMDNLRRAGFDAVEAVDVWSDILKRITVENRTGRLPAAGGGRHFDLDQYDSGRGG